MDNLRELTGGQWRDDGGGRRRLAVDDGGARAAVADAGSRAAGSKQEQ